MRTSCSHSSCGSVEECGCDGDDGSCGDSSLTWITAGGSELVIFVAGCACEIVAVEMGNKYWVWVCVWDLDLDWDWNC